MRKLIFLLLIIGSLPLLIAGASNKNLVFDTGSIIVNASDVCINNSGLCLSAAAANASGDITAVNAGFGLIGGGVSGPVTLNVSADTCGAGNVSRYNGTHFTCVVDATAAGGVSKAGDGTYLYNDSTTMFFNFTLAGINLSVNSSDNWDDLDTFNDTQMDNNGGILSIAISWFSSLFDTLFGAKDTDDLTEGSTNLYDNQTWNQTHADTLYADVSVTGDNSSWNETHANDLYVNVDGDTMTGDLNISNAAITGTNSIQFNTTFADGTATGRLQWNSVDGTLEVGMPGGDVNLQIGQELLSRAKNTEGATIFNCQAIWVSGASGTNIEVQTPIASNTSEAPLTFGLATEDIANNANGFVTVTGLVRDCDTSDWSAGDILYLSPFVEGNLTNVRPTAPNISVIIGIVRRDHASLGEIAVNPVIQQRMALASDVYSVGRDNNSVLAWSNDTNRHEYTNDPTFNSAIINNNLRVLGNASMSQWMTVEDFLATTYHTTGANLSFNFYDDGTDIFMNVTNGGGDFFIEQDNTKMELFNTPNAANDFKVFRVFSKQATDVTEFVVTKAGSAHASYFIRSLAIAGNATNTPTPFNCSTYASFIDCKTDVTGADLYVQDDIELEGSIYGGNSSWNVTDDGNFTGGFFKGDGSELTNIPGGNSSWNQTHADTLYILQANEGNLNVNNSNTTNNWITNAGGTLSDFNSTQMENNGGTLSIIISWIDSKISSVISAFFNQDLNTTSNVTFNRINGTGNISTEDWLVGNLNFSDVQNHPASITDTNCSAIGSCGNVVYNLSLFDTDDLTEGSANLYDNQSWTEVVAQNRFMNQTATTNLNMTDDFNITVGGCTQSWNGTCKIETCPTTVSIQC